MAVSLQPSRWLTVYTELAAFFGSNDPAWLRHVALMAREIVADEIKGFGRVTQA